MERALIDGEAIVLMDNGRSDFRALMTKRGWAEAAFVAFDLLRLGGDDLRQRPLEARCALSPLAGYFSNQYSPSAEP